MAKIFYFGEDTLTQFDYEKKLSRLMTPEIVSALNLIREYKGEQKVLEEIQPETFDSLVEVAKVQSTYASNKIENISTSNKRLRDLMSDKAEPVNRDEREIAGYRYVLDMIHENHDAMPITPNVILQLHRDLYRFNDDSFAGKWKDADNVIAERNEKGELVARFRPISAAATPGAIEAICAEYGIMQQAGLYDPLLISLVYSFDFVSIHPFNDGNGRMSRLLTLLLLYQSGYSIGKYISIEKEIERTKETYYEALAASSQDWATGDNDYSPYITYMLGVITACYKELRHKIGSAKSGNNDQALRDYFERTVEGRTKQEIMDDNPTMSKRTIERILSKLQKEGLIEKVGAARATKYRRNN